MPQLSGRDYPLSETPSLSPVSQGPGSPMPYTKSISKAAGSVGNRINQANAQVKSQQPKKEPNSVGIIKAGADVVRAAREDRANIMNAKANKITARKSGRADILKAKAELARAKRGQ